MMEPKSNDGLNITFAFLGYHLLSQPQQQNNQNCSWVETK